MSKSVISLCIHSVSVEVIGLLAFLPISSLVSFIKGVLTLDSFISEESGLLDNKLRVLRKLGTALRMRV